MFKRRRDRATKQDSTTGANGTTLFANKAGVEWGHPGSGAQVVEGLIQQELDADGGEHAAMGRFM